ncbi:MAG: hypothetical protein U5O39_03360 [Gammaproteobacteria bacterium]|nr:hypothetical protein [Gammaproteobacteria bacterium]
MRNDYHDGVLAINSANADAHDSDELMQRIVDNALTLRGLAMGAMVHLSYLAQDLPAGCSHSASEQVDILMAETTAILDAAEQSLAFLDRIERPTPAMRDRELKRHTLPDAAEHPLAARGSPGARAEACDRDRHELLG